MFSDPRLQLIALKSLPVTYDLRLTSSAVDLTDVRIAVSRCNTFGGDLIDAIATTALQLRQIVPEKIHRHLPCFSRWGGCVAITAIA
jgi:hypothetical protein